MLFKRLVNVFISIENYIMCIMENIRNTRFQQEKIQFLLFSNSIKKCLLNSQISIQKHSSITLRVFKILT
ncbi:hypothetical protein EJB00_03285 [Wolbachia endosymbiont of Drosophila mauritiana]|nr:hypothetical protein EJA99_03295 [Wolbachia endosymbiont of Drosophila mauritiana]QCB63678.1 hypothetical protein EJB00_03285 [Wolbachia endosymbiont of Drosophila mauritiana]TGB05732.1 hypothetical protein E5C28_06160 [Wolbachia endosymbiont of Drosophila mauritiana]